MGGLGLPDQVGVAVVEEYDAPARPSRGHHARHRRRGTLDPLQDARGGDEVECRIRIEVEDVALLEAQTGDVGVLLARQPEQHGIAVDPERDAFRADDAGDAGRDGAGSAAHVQHPHAWAHQRGEAPMVTRQGAAVQDLPVG